MLDMIPKRIALITKAYADQEIAARAAAEKRGIAFWKPDDKFDAAMKTFRAGEVEAVAKDITKLGGAADAKPIVERARRRARAVEGARRRRQG